MGLVSKNGKTLFAPIKMTYTAAVKWCESKQNCGEADGDCSLCDDPKLLLNEDKASWTMATGQLDGIDCPPTSGAVTVANGKEGCAS
jgi:hypothetical protein